MHLAPRLASLFAGVIAATSIAAATTATAAPTPQCKIPGAREIAAASLYITDSTAFDSYQFVYIEKISYRDPTRTLNRHQQRSLNSLIRDSIEKEWRERLGWRSVTSPGDGVVSLSIDVENPAADNDQLRLNTRLRDSVTGTHLLSQCDTRLALDSQQLASAHHTDQLQRQVSHWGAGLGSHIMTIY